MNDGAGEAQRTQQVELSQVSLPRLLFALLRQRFSGTVTLQQPPPQIGNRRVWFRGGMPVFTDWVEPQQVLGRVLLMARAIDENQFLVALEAMAAHGGLLGEHLQQQGVIDRATLLEGLRTQCARKLQAVFALRAGAAYVSAAATDGLEPDLRPVNVLALILAGVGSCFDETRIDDELQVIARSPVQATASLAKYRAHFGFRPADAPIIDAIASGGTAWAFESQTTAGRTRVLQLMYTLWACQMLRATGPAQTPPSPVRPAAAPPPPATPIDAGGQSTPPSPTVAAPPLRTSPAPRPPTPSVPAAERPSAASPPAGDPDDPFLAKLVALERQLEEGAHAFALFDLPLTAGKRDVRRAWGDLSRLFHPDAQQSPDRAPLRDRVSKVFAGLSEAQQLLGDEGERTKLRESIEHGDYEAAKGGQDATAQAHAVFRAELVAKEADKLLRANRFDRALARYREAASHNPDEPDVTAAIAWCEYQTSDKQPERSRLAYDSLSTVIREAPKTSRAHYFLGFVLVDQGNPAAAIDSFTKAAEIDPRLIDAQRQARALKVKMGRPVASVSAPKEKKRGGLRGLFGKK